MYYQENEEEGEDEDAGRGVAWLCRMKVYEQRIRPGFQEYSGTLGSRIGWSLRVH
jgi:hypothetical protein